MFTWHDEEGGEVLAHGGTRRPSLLLFDGRCCYACLKMGRLLPYLRAPYNRK